MNATTALSDPSKQMLEYLQARRTSAFFRMAGELHLDVIVLGTAVLDALERGFITVADNQGGLDSKYAITPEGEAALAAA